MAGFGTRRSLGSIGTITEPGSLLQIKPVAITNVESEETDYIVGNRKRPKQCKPFLCQVFLPKSNVNCKKVNDYEMTASRERKVKACCIVANSHIMHCIILGKGNGIKWYNFLGSSCSH